MIGQIKQKLLKQAPPWLKDFYYQAVAQVAALYYGWPSRRLVVIGVTGTKGKSSSIMLIKSLLEGAGKKVGWTSSVSFGSGTNEVANDLHMTMPGRFFIQRWLRTMVRAGCTHALIEVTSEGVKQFRHSGINFDVAVFTNLAPEHLEAHGGLSKYRAAKREFFKALASAPRKRDLAGAKETPLPKTSIVNIDSEHAPYFLAVATDHTIGFSVSARSAAGVNEIIKAEDLLIKPNGSSFVIRGVAMDMRLPGTFNVYNVLGAIAVAVNQGVSLLQIQKSLKQIKPPAGRMQFIESGQPFKVVVDYAHTPDSLRAVYEALRANIPPGGRLMGVLGATGGGRDKWKRPVLGAIAEEFCDEVVVTNEDPYDEDPLDIMHGVVKGIERRDKVRLEKDRRLAIRYAFQTAKPRDTIVITGKGSEQTMIVGGRAEPWSDFEVCAAELQALGYKPERAWV